MNAVHQIALDYAVHPMQVRLCKRAIQDQAKNLCEGKRGQQPVSAGDFDSVAATNSAPEVTRGPGLVRSLANGCYQEASS